MTLLYVIIGVSALILIYSIIAYFRYYFYIQNEELIVEKGVFQKSRTNIPFERIQTVNFEQSVLHQLFRVVKLEIDTAGSKGSEFSFAALDIDLASQLRNVLLTNRTKKTFEGEQNYEDTIVGRQADEKTVMKLSLSELIRIGFLENHVRSFLLIIAFFSWIMGQLNEIGVSTEVFDEIDSSTLFYSKVIVIFFAISSIFVSVLISVARTVLRFYEFRLLRTQDGFKIETGLFNRRQIAAKDHKVQLVNWADNPLKRLLKIHDVFLKQASSVKVQNKKSIVIPGCDPVNLNIIKNYYYNDVEWLNLHTLGISKKYIYRRFLYFGLVPFIIGFISLYFAFELQIALLAIIWLPISFIAAVIRHKKWKLHINDHLIHVQSGLFGNYNKTLKLFKIQSISLDQSIFHRINKLMNVTVHTASGQVNIPFIPEKTAVKLVDYLQYKVEIDKRSWM